MISSLLWSLQAQVAAPQNSKGSPPRQNHAGKLVAALGWLLTGGAMISLLIGFSDLQNLAFLAITGVIFIPIGLLLITNGRILSKLTNIEKNTGVTVEENSRREAPKNAIK